MLLDVEVSITMPARSNPPGDPISVTAVLVDLSCSPTQVIGQLSWTLYSTPALLMQSQYISYFVFHSWACRHAPVCWTNIMFLLQPIERKWDLCFVGSTTGILNTIMWPDRLRSTTDSDPCGGKVVIVSAMLSACCVSAKRSPCGRLRHRIATGKLDGSRTDKETQT